MGFDSQSTISKALRHKSESRSKQKEGSKDFYTTTTSRRSISNTKNTEQRSPLKQAAIMNLKGFDSPSKLGERFKVKGNSNSRSSNNLLNIDLKKVQTNSGFSHFQTVNEFDELSIEEQMQRLPHWKYSAAFENYMAAAENIPVAVVTEFMELYRK